MSSILRAVPITADAIAGLAELIEASGGADKLINQDQCERFHDRATLDMTDGQAGISLFNSACFEMPFKMDMMERHPLGSQAFLPMQEAQYLVVLARDKDGAPHDPQAYIAGPGQGVNIGRNVWHGVLCPLKDTARDRGLFMVVDRITDGPNLEEYWFEHPYIIERDTNT